MVIISISLDIYSQLCNIWLVLCIYVQDIFKNFTCDLVVEAQVVMTCFTWFLYSPLLLTSYSLLLYKNLSWKSLTEDALCISHRNCWFTDDLGYRACYQYSNFFWNSCYSGRGLVFLILSNPLHFCAIRFY